MDWAGKEWIKTTPIYTAFHKDNLLLQPISYSTQSNEPRDIPDLHKCFELFAQRNNLDENNKWYLISFIS